MDPHANPSHSTTHTSPPAPVSTTIELAQFMNLIQLRTATIVAAEIVPNKDKLYKLTLQVGNETRTVVSGIRQWYSLEELVGKTIAILANLAPKKLGGIESQGMILAALDDEGQFSLLVTERPVKSGAEVR